MAAETSSPEQVQTQDWMEPIKEKLKILLKRYRRSLKLSIFTVPNILRKVNQDVYSPRIVSIGPFHSSTTTTPLLQQTMANKDDHLRAEEDDRVSIGPFHSSTTTTPLLQQTMANKDDHLRAEEDDRWQQTVSLHKHTLVKKHVHLQDMEEQKWWYTFYLIWRTREPMDTLDLFGKAIMDLEERVRGTYAGDITVQSHELAEIMLIDGCFILELFIRSWNVNVCQKKSEDGDLIFLNTWMLPTLRQDLTLLENQIPFCILKDLYDIFVKQAHSANQDTSVTQLALSFFHPDLNEGKLKSNVDQFGKKYGQDDKEPWKHLLDLLHKFYFCTYPETDPQGEKDLKSEGQEDLESNQKTLEFEKCATETDPQGKKDLKSNQKAIKETSTSLEIDPEGQEDLESNQKTQGFEKCATETHPEGQEDLESNKKTQGFGKRATELSEAGIVFEKVTRDDLLLAVEFHEGVIKIQQLCIDLKTESLLRNLIAFEQWSPTSKQLATSYVTILNSLVRSSDDVELLKQRDIITPNSVEVEKVLTFFKNISWEMKPEDFCLRKQCTDVNNYQNSWWHCRRIKAFFKVRCLRYLKVLKRDYFSSPWSIISLIAGVVLLILTAVQTYYAVRSYSSSQFLTNNLFPQFDQKILLKEEHHRRFPF